MIQIPIKVKYKRRNATASRLPRTRVRWFSASVILKSSSDKSCPANASRKDRIAERRIISVIFPEAL